MFMEFDPSRRLFLRRAGLATVVPIVVPVIPADKIIKYFFAPTGGWRDAELSVKMIRSWDAANSIAVSRIDTLYGFSWHPYSELLKTTVDYQQSLAVQ